MAAARICDSCGEFYKFDDGENVANRISIEHANEAGKMAKTIKTYDLCPDCMNAIQSLLSK